jgi:hypothetical protein
MSRPRGGVAALGLFADRVDRLTVADLTLLCETWAADDENERRQAWREVRALADETGRSTDLEELRNGLVRWAGVPGRSGLAPLSVLVPSLREEAAQRRKSLAPLLDAGAALLVGDRLSDRSYSVLMHPWNVVRQADVAGAGFDAPTTSRSP